MKKTRQQITKYLSRRSYTPQDWDVILMFCHKKFGSGARKAIRPKAESTIDEFMEWLQNGIGDGDIVTDNCGRVGVYSNDGVKGFFMAYLDGEKVVTDKVICQDPKPVDSKTAEVFYEKMSEQGLSYRISLSSVTEIKLPEIGTRCRVMFEGKVYAGVFSGTEGRMAKFLFLVTDKDLLRDVRLDLWDLTFMKEGASDVRKIHDILSENGLMIDKASVKLVEITERQSRGGSYWYLTDRLTVASCVDTGTMTHKARYDCHNYFSSFIDADKVRRHLLEIGERLAKRESL